jgi:CAAX protease family protein
VSTEPIPPRPDAPTYPASSLPPVPGEARGLAARPKATWRWWEAIGVYLGAFLVAGFATLPIIRLVANQDLATMVASLTAALVILGLLVLWLRTSHPGWVDVLGVPTRWGPEVRAGIVFGIGLYPAVVFVVGVLLTVLLQFVSGESVRTPEQVPQHLPGIGTAVTIAYGVLIAPIAEEFFFRGVLFRSIRDRHGFWVGAVASGFAFGLIHYIPGPALNAALLMSVMVFTGIGLAFIYERRGWIVAPIAAHMTFNVIGLTLIYILR